MNRARAAVLCTAALLAATLASVPGARAAGTPPPRSAKATVDSFPAAPPDSQAAPMTGARSAAEKRYAEGFALAGEASKDLTGGRTERAKKKFGKARKLFESATQLDGRYYQAWNMLGYCARQCGDLKAAFDAYGKCLEIQPEYAAAHEYLGETYLRAGQMEKAKAELEWLRAHDSELAATLAEKIEHPGTGGADSWKSAGEWKEPAADSTGAGAK